jgi:hypothetical protein
VCPPPSQGGSAAPQKDASWILAQCRRNAAEMPEFIAQLNRLAGYHLQDDSSPESEDCLAFALFVAKDIWRPGLEEQSLPCVSQIHAHPMMGQLWIEI